MQRSHHGRETRTPHLMRIGLIIVGRTAPADRFPRGETLLPRGGAHVVK